MRRATRPTTSAANRRYQLPSIDTAMPTSRSQSRQSMTIAENNKHILFLNAWDVFETSVREMYENNIKLINNPDNLQNIITKASVSFGNFFQTISRLCGNIITMKQGRKPGLVTGSSAIRASYTPFNANWLKLNDELEQQYLFIYRQISVEFENCLLPMKSFITQNLNQYTDSTTQLLSLFSELKKSVEIVFQSEEYLHQGSSYFSEIVNNIQTILSTLQEISIEDQNTFLNSLNIMFRAVITFLMNYHSLISSRNQFQEILDDYVMKLEINMETSRSTVPNHPPPLTATLPSREYMSKSPPSVISQGPREIRYLGGTTLEEIIESGKKVIGNEQQSHRLFFDDLYKIAAEFRKITDLNHKYSQINNYLFDKDILADNEIKSYKELIKKAQYNEHRIINLELEMNKLKNQASEAHAEKKEFEEDNKRLSRINTEQNDRFNNFIGKMADLIGSEPSEEKMLAKLDQTRNNQACASMNQFLFGDQTELYLPSFQQLSSQLLSFREELLNFTDSKDKENATYFDITNLLKEKMQNNQSKPAKEVTFDQNANKSEQDLNRLKNSIMSMLKSANKPLPQNASLSDMITHLSKVVQAAAAEYSQEFLNKTFSSVLDLIDVSSKSVPSVYLPEVCYYFMLMYQSINYLKKFTTDMDEVFDKFEFKMPKKQTKEYENLKHTCFELTKHLHEIEPSSMHSVVFHSVSRFVILIDALVNNS